MNSPNLCPDYKNTKKCFMLFSSKSIVDNFYKDFSKKNAEKLSIFNAKLTLNNAPCELECNFTIAKISNFYGTLFTIIGALIALIVKDQTIMISYFLEK
jgi:hypothetical protein